MKILIVDDDPLIVENLQLTFKVSWPDSKILSTGFGKEAVNIVETREPDLVILDLGLPDISGFEVLKRIRLFSNAPIIVLTVRSEEGSVVKAIEWGADEFIVKPFRQMELLARIKLITRRQCSTSKSSESMGPYIIDLSTNSVSSGTKTVKLTIIESAILHVLISNRGQYIDNANLAARVWGENYQGCDKALRVHIRHLREKIEQNPSKPRYITNKPGAGYGIPLA